MKTQSWQQSKRADWRRWAKKNPEKAQANRNAWATSKSGQEWLKKNQKKKNAARDAWREARRKAGLKYT